MVCALFKLLSNKTPYGEGKPGDDSALQVRHVAASRLSERLGLGPVPPTKLLDERDLDQLLSRIKETASQTGICNPK